MHLWPLLFPFRYVGFSVYEPAVFHGVGGVAFIEGHDGAVKAVEQYSARWADTLKALPDRGFVPYNRDNDFDETKRLKSEAPVYSPFVRHSPEWQSG